MIFLILLAIVGGCILLYYGAEFLVVGASRIATGVGFPKAIAGLTLVAVGTSAPELFVNALSASRGHTAFAMSNISGSNLANLCLGFGVCGLIAVLPISRSTFGEDLLFLVLTPVIIVVTLLIPPQHVLHLWSLVALTIGLVLYGRSILRRARLPDEEVDAAPPGRVRDGVVRFSIGSVLLYGGAELVLLMSQRLAGRLGIGEAIIGLTIVAAGTSVPDITASIVATMRRENGIAVGNLLGSNISNILFVLNTTLLVSGSGLQTDAPGTTDYVVVLALSILFAAYAFIGQRMTRSMGILLLLIYAAYMSGRIWGAAM